MMPGECRVKVSTLRRKPPANAKQYCIYCNEELGADPTHCIYCGATLSNPLATTSEVRQDLRDSDFGMTSYAFPKQPISWKRQALGAALVVAVGAPGFLGHHIAELWLPLLPLAVGVAYLCAAVVTVARCWLAQTGYRWDGAIFRSYSDRLGTVATVIWLWALLAHVVQATSCDGSCTGQVAGAEVATVVEAVTTALLVIAVTALAIVRRARSRARRRKPTGPAKVQDARSGVLPGSEPWGTAYRSEATRSTRFRRR